MKDGTCSTCTVDKTGSGGKQRFLALVVLFLFPLCSERYNYRKSMFIGISRFTHNVWEIMICMDYESSGNYMMVMTIFTADHLRLFHLTDFQMTKQTVTEYLKITSV